MNLIKLTSIGDFDSVPLVVNVESICSIVQYDANNHTLITLECGSRYILEESFEEVMTAISDSLHPG